ncbi:MAG: hypothetical protein J1E78_00120 [Muribaculaceae bacterium]|nr:hypothetical protein [Muribaculaceae bacterium]
MKRLNLLYKYIFFVIVTFLASSCVDDNIKLPETSQSDTVGDGSGDYCLQFVFNLDNMGGAATRASNPMQDIENYVDLEKVRILFFSCEGKYNDDDYEHDFFLFEPKNHWVKKLDADESNPNRWLVSVPMYTHGNNAEGYSWDWDFIRQRLTSAPFKIAILANRPEYDYVDRFAGNADQSLAIDAGWMPNKGPLWGSDDALSQEKLNDFENVKNNPEALKNALAAVKDVFDLHHCQTDINYINKSTNVGYYSFVMGDWNRDKDGNAVSWATAYNNVSINTVLANEGPKMGATASWVDWDYYKLDDNGNKISITYTSNGEQVISYCQNDGAFINSSRAYAKRFRNPSYDYPIPMYGIQLFDPIKYDNSNEELWQKGSPFYLSEGIPGQEPIVAYNQKSISILRSVVKMELIIPKSVIGDNFDNLTMVGVAYSNIYSRCEPMDVWTPTDKIWADMHEKSNGSYIGGDKCEIENILNYGSICTTSGSAHSSNELTDYQYTMSWFYGAWKEKGWDFNGFTDIAPESTGKEYPQIFNTTIQRNQLVICDDNVLFDDYGDDNLHYIIYCGEKNSMDPSNLNSLHATGSANAVFQYWILQIGDNSYAVPITDYGNSANAALKLTPLSWNDGKEGATSSYSDLYINRDGKKYLPRHAHQRTADGKTETCKTAHDYLQEQITNSPTDQTHLPWPLIRNHVYRITLSKKSDNNGSAQGRSRSEEKALEITATCQDFHSKKF